MPALRWLTNLDRVVEKGSANFLEPVRYAIGHDDHVFLAPSMVSVVLVAVCAFATPADTISATATIVIFKVDFMMFSYPDGGGRCANNSTSRPANARIGYIPGSGVIVTRKSSLFLV